MGITDVNQVLTLDDLVRTDDVIFAATAITRGNLLNPIQYFPGGARTHTIVMRSKLVLYASLIQYTWMIN